MAGKRAVWGGLRTVNYVNSHVPWVYRCPLVVCGREHNKGRIINPQGLKRNLLTHIFQQHKSLPQPLLVEVYNKDRVKTQTIYVPQPRAHATAKSYHKSLTGVDSQESKKGVSPGTVDADNMEVLDFDGDIVTRAKTFQPTIQEMFRGMTAKERSNEEADHEEMQESQQEHQRTISAQTRTPSQQQSEGNNEAQPQLSDQVPEKNVDNTYGLRETAEDTAQEQEDAEQMFNYIMNQKTHKQLESQQAPTDKQPECAHVEDHEPPHSTSAQDELQHDGAPEVEKENSNAVQQESEDTRIFHSRLFYGEPCTQRTQPSYHNRDTHDAASDISIEEDYGEAGEDHDTQNGSYS